MAYSLVSSLRDLGLHKSEVAVYLFLLRNGASTVINVSHGTNIARTNCYHVIRQLLQKGLIAKQTLGSKIAFVANELHAIDDFVESKARIAQSIMPDLESAYFRGSLKPQVTFLSTDAGISSLLHELQKTDRLTFYGPKPGDPEIIRFFYESIRTSADKVERSIIHPRRSVDCYFILWSNKVAIIPISVTPHITIIQNDDISRSISSMIRT